MKNKFLGLLLLSVFVACKSITLIDQKVTAPKAVVELGSIVQEKPILQVKGFPYIANKVKVQVTYTPFNKSLAKSYTKRSLNESTLLPLTYVDSVAVKPEITVLTLVDEQEFINELNNEQNTALIQLLEKVNKLTLVSTVALYLKKEDNDKLKQAQTCYLISKDNAKFMIALYKDGKKFDAIDLQHASVVGYKSSSFCWSVDSRGKWKIAYIVPKGTKCSGVTTLKVTEKKKERNLYKL